MKHMPQVIAVMTPFPHSIDVDATVAEARLMMDAKGFHHLPVTELGRLCGVLSDRDLRVAAGPGPERDVAAPLRVRDIYREEVYDPNTTRRGVADIIIAKQRNGPIGEVQLTFLGEYTRFENLASSGNH